MRPGHQNELMPPDEPAPVVQRDAVYTKGQLQRLLKLPKETVNAEIHAGRLRAAKIGFRHVIRGLWVFQWLKACEVRKYRKAGAVDDDAA
jgi:hypothetical protein